MAKKPSDKMDSVGIDWYGDESNERSPDLDHNKGKSVSERGFIPDDNDFHEPGPYERKDRWGNVVSHQDSQTYPGRRR